MPNFNRNLQNVKWYATTVEGSKKIATMYLSSSDTKLLFYLLSNIDSNNIVKLKKYLDISEEINLSIASIKKSMKKLKEENLIVKDLEEKKTIFINPEFFYAGDYKIIEDKKEYFNACKNKNKKEEKPTR